MANKKAKILAAGVLLAVFGVVAVTATADNNRDFFDDWFATGETCPDPDNRQFFDSWFPDAECESNVPSP